MPIIKSAKKQLRQSKKRQRKNRQSKDALKEAIKLAKIKKTKETVRQAISLVAKAAKKNIMHKNKAARITSQLSKLTKSLEKTLQPRLVKAKKTVKAKAKKKK